MKKFFLLAAAAVAALSSQAALSDILTVSIDGTEITEGATVNISEYTDMEALVPGYGYQYQAKIVVTNKTAKNVPNTIKVTYTDHPSKEMEAAEPAKWGTLQICYANAVEGEGCVDVLDVTKTVPANGSMTWDFDNKKVSATEGESNRKYNIAIVAEGQTLNFTVCFAPSSDTAVNEIAVNDNSAVYYNLQGQRVENPANGLYIIKKNGKTSKMVIR